MYLEQKMKSSTSNIVSMVVNHGLAVVNEFLNLLLQSFFCQLSGPVQRGLFQLTGTFKSSVCEVRFHPAEEKSVTQIKVRAVRALIDGCHLPFFHELLDFASCMRPCIIPHPENLIEVDWVRTQVSPQGSSVPQEVDDASSVHTLNRCNSRDGKSLAW